MKLRTSLVLALLAGSCLSTLRVTSAAEPSFQAEELKTKLGVGYAVRLIDMNDDKKLDIAIVDQERILWLENPTWTEHIMIEKQTKADNVCFAPSDIDGDGKIDFAVGADWKPFNTNSGGTIQWIKSGKSINDPWTVYPIGEVPTVHRMAFADLDRDGKEELIVAPLLGRGSTRPDFSQTTVELLSFKIPADPVGGPWKSTVISDKLRVTHNLHVTEASGDPLPEILWVGREGVYLLEQEKTGWKHTRVGIGDEASLPHKGASEVKHGKLATSDYIATIEPWHGNQVVVYTRPDGERPASGDWLWNRVVLDNELLWGHAVSCVNLDDDADQELVIGIRDNQNETRLCGVRIYDPIDAAAGKWKRTIIDAGGVAVEDLATGDLNGDGRADIVAVGRATHNVKIYWNAPAPK